MITSKPRSVHMQVAQLTAVHNKHGGCAGTERALLPAGSAKWECPQGPWERRRP